MEDARESHLVSNRLTRWAAQRFLRFTGWKSEGNGPAARKFVLIAAPHTTNWDLIYMLAIAWDLDVDISWMGKHAIFRWPFGGLMKYLGGIPVRRNARKNAVDRFERRYFTELLRKTQDNKAAAARMAGMDRANFRRTLKRVGLAEPTID